VSDDNWSKNPRVRVLQIGASVVLFLGVAGYFFWELTYRTENVQLAWVVVDQGEPLVAYFERVSGDDDYFRVTTRVASDGRKVERTTLADSWDSTSWVGPVFGHFMWILDNKQLYLFDLASHDDEVVAKGVGRTLGSFSVDATGRAHVIEGRDHVLVGKDGAREKKERGSWSVAGRDGACADAGRAAKRRLDNANVRGCWEQRAFVHHSAGAEKGNWQLSLVETDGSTTWTLDAAQLSGNPRAWFGHAVVHDKACWTVIVEPGWDVGIRFVEAGPTTGEVTINREL